MGLDTSGNYLAILTRHDVQVCRGGHLWFGTQKFTFSLIPSSIPRACLVCMLFVYVSGTPVLIQVWHGGQHNVLLGHARLKDAPGDEKSERKDDDAESEDGACIHHCFGSKFVQKLLDLLGSSSIGC